MEPIRIKQRPECRVCGKEILDDFCIVLNKKDKFGSCACLDCRDSLQEELARIGPYWEKKLIHIIDRAEEETPCLECEIIFEAGRGSGIRRTA